MRSEQKMFDLILGIAKADERIRAVYMNGSRTNPNVPKDKYQDFDIVYVVTETASFLSDKNWIHNFGELAMVQEPYQNDIDNNEGNATLDFSRRYAWLMLFRDGNRIDLTIEILDEAKTHILEDKLTIQLLDKDGNLPQIPESTDEDYHVKRPNVNNYDSCCNEFWWCLNNVAKGIARDELPYAMEMYNHYVRDMLNRMVEWQIGIDMEFSVSAGKMGKYFKRYLSPQQYEMYAKTYSDSDYNHFWTAIFTACELFRTLGRNVARHLNFTYNEQDNQNVMEYLVNIKNEK